MTQNTRIDLVQGIAEDAVARVERGEFTAEDMEDAIDAVCATADAFMEDLTEEEIEQAAKLVLQDFA